jgi:nitric oxide reductase NorD protein
MSVATRDPAERFSMLAAAVAGRNVAVVPGACDRPYSDGERIVVPPHHGNAIRDGLVVQAALIAAGSLDPRTVSRLTGRKRLRHRYLTLEAMRAIESLSALVPPRVRDKVAAIYDGPLPRSPEESLARALSERERVPEAPEWLGTIRPGKVIMAASPLRGSTPASKDVDLPELDDDEDSDRSRILEFFQAPAMQMPLAQYLQKMLGMGRSPDPDAGGGEELPVGSKCVGKVGENARVVQGVIPPAPDPEAPPAGRLYPEWDDRRRAYRRDWCSVTEYDPRPPEEEPILDADRDPPLLRQLARLGLAHERRRRQHEGDVLDITAVIDLVVDKATATTADERVYEVNRRTAHDLGVLVLLDASGSTGESDEVARVFDEQRALAARLTAALDELGNRVAAYGFQSRGRGSVNYLRVKGFDDRYDHAARRRLASLEPAGFTRLGAAIRHGTHLLTERAGTSNALLVVVGDGFPYDDGYERRYAHADCRRALAEAVLVGVGCACISVRTSTEAEILRDVWGSVPHEMLDRPSEVSRRVAPLFRRALKEAAASRRRVEGRMEAVA